MAGNREDQIICTACGTQFDTPFDRPLSACKICDDPRQFVPPTGQSWTSLSQMREKYTNRHTQDKVDARIWSITTEPKFAIGQRCLLLETPEGNVLWDLICYLDEDTIKRIKSRGGLKAIVVSHPHYYTTHLHWAEVFDCPVYLAAADQEWLSQVDQKGRRQFIGECQTIVPGVQAIQVGGHFPGSLVLHWEKKLFIADSLVTVPSALYHIDRPAGTISYTFMWSIPNMIPLPPNTIFDMWQALKDLNFDTTHGAFLGMDVRDPRTKARVLESMKIQVRAAGWQDSAILKETEV